MADNLVLRGTPTELDSYLKPVGRGLQLLLVVPVTLALWWLQAWWWLPLPLMLTELAYQLLFASRGDRPTELRLAPEAIELRDPLRDEVVRIDPRTVEVATATWRRLERGSEVVVLLADADGPGLAVRFTLPTPPQVLEHDVDVDEIDARLGGQAGVLKAVAPFERVARQRFTDPAGLRWLREALPPESWRRTGVRVWRGEAPPLSPFGFHLTEPSGWLVLDGDAFDLRGPEPARGALARPLEATIRERLVSLLVKTEDGPEEEISRLPLLGLHLAAGLRVVFPAPAAVGRAASTPASAADLHTHAAEGAALIHHLWRVMPEGELPPLLRLRPDSQMDTMAAP